MELIIRHFTELSAEELYEMYRLRVTVFVVEQRCPYQEIDVFDKAAYHLWLKDAGGIQAYARVLPPHTCFEEASIGRVIAVRRRCGLGSQIVRAAIAVAKDRFSAGLITIEAQTQARALYEKAGFRAVSDVFSEDGIPHIKMQLTV